MIIRKVAPMRTRTGGQASMIWPDQCTNELRLNRLLEVKSCLWLSPIVGSHTTIKGYGWCIHTMRMWSYVYIPISYCTTYETCINERQIQIVWGDKPYPYNLTNSKTVNLKLYSICVGGFNPPKKFPPWPPTTSSLVIYPHLVGGFNHLETY